MSLTILLEAGIAAVSFAIAGGGFFGATERDAAQVTSTVPATNATRVALHGEQLYRAQG